ncbi:hypothetical protein [Francisella orientalis]|uniref:Uncharacterized protein n=2 Tax=Francisella orientalis TaxID=299583 RepID=A0AAP7FTY0_9GAMM|nr:hypothetical protein [Francisella orientalis]APD41761.1 hypothetical protein BMT43_07740 [Francisella orientalis]MBK2005343.1 hypothetical protein [Francisella orientalis]MBK2006781.1 hypothetical protein [Francisella orientalis]MBK2008241.1 hypothetical protein [Francisella orientalis]MBK2009805.1 hypothetical protein [Francisella orientalis]
MRLFILLTITLISLNRYGAVYESYSNRVPEFTNTPSKGATKLNLADDAITVINADNIPKQVVWEGNRQYGYSDYSQPYQDTLQAAFPEEFTDNYFDFYGRNYQYHSLMSSSMG